MKAFSLGGDLGRMKGGDGLMLGEGSCLCGGGGGGWFFCWVIGLGMKERGCVGSLVDGGIWDVRWIGQHEFPVFARYRTPIQSIGRWKVNAWQTPVFLRGATTSLVKIEPGDFILGDEDGVLTIPAAIVEQVLEEAERLTNTEVSIRAELSAGMTLAEALKKFGHV